MILLDEIEELPEGASPAQLRPFFERALASENKHEAFNAIEDLADRQWHTYEKPQLELASRIGNWLLENWDQDSLADVEKLTSIVARLGLQPVYLKMKEELPNLPLEPRNEFQTFVDEVGNSVADPFDGMRL